MSERKYIVVSPIGRWGRFPTFAGKVGTGSSCCLLIKRARRFYVEQRIEFAMEHELRGCSTGMSFRWHVGIIWKIEDERLFVNYV